MATDPTIGELFKQALVLDADVRAAVDAYMADAETGVFPVGEGYGLDLAAAAGMPTGRPSGRWPAPAPATPSSARWCALRSYWPGHRNDEGRPATPGVTHPHGAHYHSGHGCAGDGV